MIDKIIVIKYGGNAMINETLKDAVMEDIVALREKGYMPVLSHGGGPGIKEMQEKLGLESRFVDGLRYTDEPTLRVAEAVLAGQVGTELAALLLKKGGKAAAISGVASGLYHCRPMDEKYGLVGEIDHVDTSAPDALMEAGIIPVVAPLGVDDNGQTYNINGDTAASLLAAALKADSFNQGGLAQRFREAGDAAREREQHTEFEETLSVLREFKVGNFDFILGVYIPTRIDVLICLKDKSQALVVRPFGDKLEEIDSIETKTDIAALYQRKPVVKNNVPLISAIVVKGAKEVDPNASDSTKRAQRIQVAENRSSGVSKCRIS